MTTVGKILVVLHLVFSVMFMAFAAAVFTAQNNWKVATQKATKELNDTKGKMKEMAAESDKQLGDSNQKIARLDDEIVKLKGQNVALELDTKTLTADNKQLRKDVDQQRDQAALTTTEATERKNEADLQRSKNGEFYTSREKLVLQLNKTEDERFALGLKNQEYSEKYEQLQHDYKIMRSYLASKNLTTDPKEMIVATSPPPPVDGRVLDVRKSERGSRELMEISLGSDSGLVVGHRLTVFSGKKYLGVIRLTMVEADRAVGYVDVRAKNATFRVNDEVTTKF